MVGTPSDDHARFFHALYNGTSMSDKLLAKEVKISMNLSDKILTNDLAPITYRQKESETVYRLMKLGKYLFGCLDVQLHHTAYCRRYLANLKVDFNECIEKILNENQYNLPVFLPYLTHRANELCKGINLERKQTILKHVEWWVDFITVEMDVYDKDVVRQALLAGTLETFHQLNTPITTATSMLYLDLRSALSGILYTVPMRFKKIYTHSLVHIDYNQAKVHRLFYGQEELIYSEERSYGDVW